MNRNTETRRYRPTESQFKGGANEMYVTYDLEQKTRGDDNAMYPKIKRVYIAGEVRGWNLGKVKKRSGREVYGVTIEYKQSRSGYRRKEYTAKRGQTIYPVASTTVKASSQQFQKVVEVPKQAQNVHFYQDRSKIPEKYRQALQDVR